MLTLLSNHGIAVVYVATHPDARLRDIALALGLTERTVQTIISELTEAGYLSREREGRRTRYTVNRDAPLHHPQLVGHSLGELLTGLDPNGG